MVEYYRKDNVTTCTLEIKLETFVKSCINRIKNKANINPDDIYKSYTLSDIISNEIQIYIIKKFPQLINYLYPSYYSCYIVFTGKAKKHPEDIDNSTLAEEIALKRMKIKRSWVEKAVYEYIHNFIEKIYYSVKEIDVEASEEITINYGIKTGME